MQRLNFLWVRALRLPWGRLHKSSCAGPRLPACLPAWPVHILPLSQPLPATWAACPGPQPAASSITGAGESLGWKSWPTLPSLGRAPSSFRCPKQNRLSLFPPSGSGPWLVAAF